MTQKIQLSTIGLILVGIAIISVLALNAPARFPGGASFSVGEGESIYSISKRLEGEHIITSALLFRGWVSLLGKDKDISLGEYTFESRVPLGVVIAKFIKGPDKPLLSVTIPEGHTTKEIMSAWQEVIPSLSSTLFLDLVRKDALDGYLFPSTYYPLPSYTEKDVVDLMHTTFEKEYTKHFSAIPFPKYVKTQRDVLSLAAILEGEAKSPEDMKMVSGILQKRLAEGMRLQVDVAPVTYQKSGLPATPINNPGIVAIDAVFDPTVSPYLYYLTGRNGTMHYAKTFEEHKKNIKKYL